MVPQSALDDLQTVPGLLAHREQDVVDEPAQGGLGLAAHPQHPIVHVLPVGLAAQQQAGPQRDRVEHAESGHRGQHAEHQHAPVGATQAGDGFVSPPDRRGLESGQRFQPAQVSPHRTGTQLGNLDGGQSGFDEGAGHLRGEGVGAAVGPDEVVADRGGDVRLHLGRDLGPQQGWVNGIDGCLGLLGDGA